MDQPLFLNWRNIDHRDKQQNTPFYIIVSKYALNLCRLQIITEIPIHLAGSVLWDFIELNHNHRAELDQMNAVGQTYV